MDSESLTRERAYLLWQQAGCPDGRSEEFWQAAADCIAATAVAPDAPAAKQSAPRRRAGTAASARAKALTSINAATAPAPILPA